MRISILTGNSVCKTNPLKVVSEHGLTLFIEFDGRKILFDTGQSELFIYSAVKMGIDLSQVDFLIISHGYFDNNRGLKHFMKINQKAKIFMHVNAAHKFYAGLSAFIPYHMELDQVINSQNSRIYSIKEDTQIDDTLILLEGFQEPFPQTEEHKTLFEMTKPRLITDKFNYELAMLLIENGEIVLFSGCYHSGIINIIEEVKLFSKTMRIKATFSGFHVNNPVNRENESQEYIEELTEARGEKAPVSSAGHPDGNTTLPCNEGRIGEKIQTMNTGEVIDV